MLEGFVREVRSDRSKGRDGVEGVGRGYRDPRKEEGPSDAVSHLC